METKFVKVLCDVNCQWEGLPPVYRLYVNDELFAERTWIWDEGQYLEECLQIQAPPGEYVITHELVPPHLAQIKVDNFRIELGPGKMTKNRLRIKK